MYMEQREEQERYGTVEAWARVLPISEPAIRRRMEGAESIEGRNVSGRIHIYYSESVVRRCCADLLREVPIADEQGFFLHSTIEDQLPERYATRKTWARELCVSENTVTRLLSDAIGITGRSSGHIVENGFFAESTVCQHCGHLLGGIPQADEQGFFILEEEGEPVRYGSREAWASVYQIGMSLLAKCLNGLQGISGKNATGKLNAFGYFSETDVKEACQHIRVDLPVADEKGFIVLQEEGRERKYGTATAWETVLPISQASIIRRLRGKEGITGKSKDGIVFENGYFDEETVRAACVDLLATMPVADESGFVTLEGERYATPAVWATVLPLSDVHIRNALKGITGITAKASFGRVTPNGYFAESDVKMVCAAQLAPAVQTDASGFASQEGQQRLVRYGHLRAWSLELSLHINTIKVRVAEIVSLKGKDGKNRLVDLYSEEQVRQACRDILDLPYADSSGFFMKEEKRYGTIRAWVMALGLSRGAVERCLEGRVGITGRGVNGRVETEGFFSEDVVTEVCSDLLSSRNGN